ncbi:hypothetical protein SteCoe_19937 [Stentor coeruleus]|uniref:Protein kinase domain-containing protein n=1 Tax=Stentor coeruleus TaxID=5963 RepID=A0A1R2BTB2_9CILI|nr:hypothetical protein SteCoe_19937 [Stentor coeruleus]
MASVFQFLDCRYNPEPGFWQKLDLTLPENLVNSTIFGGELMFKRRDGSFKTRRCILTSSYIYYLSKWIIPKYRANISWKTIEPFIEITDKGSLYGFRLGDLNALDFFTKSSQDLDKWLENLSPICILSTFDEDLIVIKEISHSMGSCINLCQSTEELKHRHKLQYEPNILKRNPSSQPRTHEEFAIKSYSKQAISQKPDLLQSIVNEIRGLRLVSHPNIVKLYKVYETYSHIHLVIDYFPYGDLSKRLQKVKKLSEANALKFMASLLQTLSYMHSMGIVHRDIKPENIMMMNDNSFQLKIIDFGLACDAGYGLSQKCGSPGCVAPEILRGEIYGSKADLFSAGVLMYIILTGKSPFSGRDTKEVLNKNKKCLISFSNNIFSKLTTETVELLKTLLDANPNIRCSASEALVFSCIKKVRECECVHKTCGFCQETNSDVHKIDTRKSTTDYAKKPNSKTLPKIHPHKRNFFL